MVHDARYGLTAEALEYVRERYLKSDQPVLAIAHDVGMSRGKLHKIIKAEGWRLRTKRPPRGLSEALKLDLAATEAENKLAEASRTEASRATASAADASTPGAADAGDRSANPDAPLDPVSMAARLEAAVEKQLREVESLRGGTAARGKRSAEAERVARTLATLTETLFKVRRLRQPGNISGSNDDDLPRDPDAFRLALAERIEAFVRRWNAADVSGPDRPGGGEPAGS